MTASEWKTLFVGRADEMAFLLESFESAKNGKPQFVVLLGETGLGKTRLVQEFYRALSRNYDRPNDAAPEGYWPDAFDDPGRSLDVNPRFEGYPKAGKGPIPWLWWGMRWNNPETRNVSEGGIAGYRHHLEPHIEAVSVCRKLADVTKGAGKGTLKMLASLGIDYLTLGTVGTLSDWLGGLWSQRREQKALQQQSDRTIAENRSVIQTALEDQLAASFALILDNDITNVPTVPVVLFLDDAQWADGASLRFVKRLYDAAIEGGWPLLVVATHWEREWYQFVAEVPVDCPPCNPVDLVRKLGLGDEWSGVRKLPKLAEQTLLIDAAFPGLTESVHLLLIKKVDGNPLLLYDLLGWLEECPELFEAQDLKRNLTADGLTALLRQEADSEQLIDKRFRRLSHDVKQALGWSSVQGASFLHIITEAATAQFAVAADVLRTAMLTAENPDRVVQLDWRAGNFNRGEFRQAAFHRAANRHLSRTGDADALKSGLLETLVTWTLDSRADTLPVAERRDFYGMARRDLKPNAASDDRTWQAWGRAVVGHMEAFQSEYLWQQARDAARELADARPAGWPLRFLPGLSQVSVISLLRDQRDLVRAKQLASPLAHELFTCEKPSRDASIVCNEFGHVLKLEGDRAGALVQFQRGLTVAERVFDEFGETLGELWDVMSSCDNVGVVLMLEGDRAGAIFQFRRVLMIRERLLAKYGEILWAMRDVSVSCSRVGDVLLLEGDRAGALANFRRSLELDERVLTVFGKTPEALRAVSLSCTKVGDVLHSEGDYTGALAQFRHGLEVREGLLAEYGETPEAMRGVSVSSVRVGTVLFSQGDLAGALAHFSRGLELGERLLTEYGETPGALRDVSVSCLYVGDVLLLEKDLAGALAQYRRALAIRERLLDEYGATPEALRDVSVSCNKVGDVLSSEGDRAGALTQYRRGLAIRERVLAEFGETPGAMRDYSASCERVGQVLLLDGDRIGGFAQLCRGLEIAERIIAIFGETPEALRDRAISNIKLATLNMSGNDLNVVKRYLARAFADYERMRDRNWETPPLKVERERLAVELARLDG